MISKFLSKLKSILFTNQTPEKPAMVETPKVVTKKTIKSPKTSKPKIKKKDPQKAIDNLKTLPGIGAKSAKAFYEAGFKTTKSIINAKDKDLLAVPGVGINLVKKLKKIK